MPDAQLVDALHQAVAQPVRGLLADRYRDADRHAAFAGAAVAGADQRVDGLIEIGVGHHDHVVLGAAEALRPLPVGCGGGVDVLRDVGAADEPDPLDVGVGEDGVDGLLVAVHDLEHPGGQTGLEEQLGQAHRHRRIALGGLEDERVAAGQGRTGFPQRDHGREVERRDPRDHAERLAQRIDVDARAGALGVLPLEQVGDADGELDDLDAALDVALGVRNGLAVLEAEQLGQFLGVGVDQFDELHHHPGAALRVPGGPLFLGFDRRGDGGVDVGRAGEDDLRLRLAGAGVHHVGGPGGRQLGALAVDEVGDPCGHAQAFRVDTWIS